MASFRRVLGSRIALGAALLASACQHDSTADFDDTNLHSTGGSAATSSGSSSGAAAGQGAEAATSTGGSSAEAGSSSGASGGKPAATAGTSGSSSGGKASAGGSGGKASAGAAGTGNEAGKAGNQGGSAGTTGEAGKGGGPVEPPQPITFETSDIDETHVASCMPNMNFGALPSVNVDGDQACRYEILFNAPIKAVPEGAQVSSASLLLTCSNVGDPFTVSYVAEEWAELSVKWNTRPDVGKELGTIHCEKVGHVSIDLTAAVKAWLSGAQENYGIYLRVETTDGTDFDTSEALDVSTRPKLSVTYTLPIK